MRTIKFLKTGIAIIALLILPGCRKYLDVNQDPNIARNVTTDLLLPSGQAALATVLGVDFNVIGSIWGQYWTQSPAASQYKVYEQYLPNASEYDREWGLLYSRALTDFRQTEQIGAENNESQYVAISRIMQAYTFQLITDAWGDVPFSEALKGGDGNTAPRFDRQEMVYDGIAQMIMDAKEMMDPSDAGHPGADDLVYGGDMELWEKFANTLLLKVYLRLSEVNPGKAQSGIAALYASGAEFIADGEDAQISFISTAGNQNPLYSEIVGLNFVQNLVASATVVDSMNRNRDARAFELFTVLGNNVVGLRQGNYNASASTQVSFPSALTGAEARNPQSATAPVKLLTSYESYFLQAEAAARGWGGSGTDAMLFESGITASFESLNLGDSAQVYLGTSYWGQYPAGGTQQQKIRHIITQKWFSMTGTQGFEAWTEWRRTGYPDFLVISANSIIGNNFPQSFLYPDDELTRNANFPGQKTVTTKVWWDAN